MSSDGPKIGQTGLARVYLYTTNIITIGLIINDVRKFAWGWGFRLIGIEGGVRRRVLLGVCQAPLSYKLQYSVRSMYIHSANGVYKGVSLLISLATLLDLGAWLVRSTRR